MHSLVKMIKRQMFLSFTIVTILGNLLVAEEVWERSASPPGYRNPSPWHLSGTKVSRCPRGS